MHLPPVSGNQTASVQHSTRDCGQCNKARLRSQRHTKHSMPGTKRHLSPDLPSLLSSGLGMLRLQTFLLCSSLSHSAHLFSSGCERDLCSPKGQKDQVIEGDVVITFSVYSWTTALTGGNISYFRDLHLPWPSTLSTSECELSVR